MELGMLSLKLTLRFMKNWLLSFKVFLIIEMNLLNRFRFSDWKLLSIKNDWVLFRDEGYSLLSNSFLCLLYFSVDII